MRAGGLEPGGARPPEGLVSARPCLAAAARAPRSRREDAPRAGLGWAGSAASRRGLRSCGGGLTFAPEACGAAAAAASGRDPEGEWNYTGSGNVSRAAPGACGAAGRRWGAAGPVWAALQVGVEELCPVSSPSLWGESAHTPSHGPFHSHRPTFFCLVHFGIGVSAAFVAALGPEYTDWLSGRGHG